MHPVDLDGVNLVILSDGIASPKARVIASGMGQFDGETFQVVTAEGSVFELPEREWDVVAMPMTGVWKTKFPEAEFYLVLRQD